MTMQNQFQYSGGGGAPPWSMTQTNAASDRAKQNIYAPNFLSILVRQMIQQKDRPAFHSSLKRLHLYKNAFSDIFITH